MMTIATGRFVRARRVISFTPVRRTIVSKRADRIHPNGFFRFTSSSLPKRVEARFEEQGGCRYGGMMTGRNYSSDISLASRPMVSQDGTPAVSVIGRLMLKREADKRKAARDVSVTNTH